MLLLLIILFPIIHGLLTLFFLGDFQNYLKFLILWVGPLFLVIIFWVIYLGLLDSTDTVMNMINGLLLPIALIMVSSSVPLLNTLLNKYLDYSVAILSLLGISWPIIMSFIKLKKFYAYLYHIYICFIVIMIFQLVNVAFLSLHWSTTLLSLLFIVFTYIIIVKYCFMPKYLKRRNDKIQQSENVPTMKETVSDREKFNALFFVIALLLIIVFVAGPQLTGLTGKYVRMMMPNHAGLQSIELNIDSNNNSKIVGRFVLEKDDTLYISNESWELELIKTQSFYIKPGSAKKTNKSKTVFDILK